MLREARKFGSQKEVNALSIFSWIYAYLEGKSSILKSRLSGKRSKREKGVNLTHKKYFIAVN